MYFELIAIVKAISYINSVDFDRFVLLTNSESALQHLPRSASYGKVISIACRILESIFRLQLQHESNPLMDYILHCDKSKRTLRHTC